MKTGIFSSPFWVAAAPSLVIAFAPLIGYSAPPRSNAGMDRQSGAGAAKADRSINEASIGKGSILRSDGRTQFKQDRSKLTLQSGIMLVSSGNKTLGREGIDVETADGKLAATVKGTLQVAYSPGKYTKIVVLEGEVRLKMPGVFGEYLELKAGQMVIANPASDRLPEAVETDVGELARTSALANGGKGGLAALPGLAALTEASAGQLKEQKSGKLARTPLVMAGADPFLRMEQGIERQRQFLEPQTPPPPPVSQKKAKARGGFATGRAGLPPRNRIGSPNDFVVDQSLAAWQQGRYALRVNESTVIPGVPKDNSGKSLIAAVWGVDATGKPILINPLTGKPIDPLTEEVIAVFSNGVWFTPDGKDPLSKEAMDALAARSEGWNWNFNIKNLDATSDRAQLFITPSKEVVQLGGNIDLSSKVPPFAPNSTLNVNGNLWIGGSGGPEAGFAATKTGLTLGNLSMNFNALDQGFQGVKDNAAAAEFNTYFINLFAKESDIPQDVRDRYKAETGRSLPSSLREVIDRGILDMKYALDATGKPVVDATGKPDESTKFSPLIEALAEGYIVAGNATRADEIRTRFADYAKYRAYAAYQAYQAYVQNPTPANYAPFAPPAPVADRVDSPINFASAQELTAVLALLWAKDFESLKSGKTPQVDLALANLGTDAPNAALASAATAESSAFVDSLTSLLRDLGATPDGADAIADLQQVATKLASIVQNVLKLENTDGGLLPSLSDLTKEIRPLKIFSEAAVSPFEFLTAPALTPASGSFADTAAGKVIAANSGPQSPLINALVAALGDTARAAELANTGAIDFTNLGEVNAALLFLSSSSDTFSQLNPGYDTDSVTFLDLSKPLGQGILNTALQQILLVNANGDTVVAAALPKLDSPTLVQFEGLRRVLKGNLDIGGLPDNWAEYVALQQAAGNTELRRDVLPETKIATTGGNLGFSASDSVSIGARSLTPAKPEHNTKILSDSGSITIRSNTDRPITPEDIDAARRIGQPVEPSVLRNGNLEQQLVVLESALEFYLSFYAEGDPLAETDPDVVATRQEIAKVEAGIANLANLARDINMLSQQSAPAGMTEEQFRQAQIDFTKSLASIIGDIRIRNSEISTSTGSIEIESRGLPESSLLPYLSAEAQLDRGVPGATVTQRPEQGDPMNNSVASTARSDLHYIGLDIDLSTIQSGSELKISALSPWEESVSTPRLPVSLFVDRSILSAPRIWLNADGNIVLRNSALEGAARINASKLTLQGVRSDVGNLEINASANDVAILGKVEAAKGSVEINVSDNFSASGRLIRGTNGDVQRYEPFQIVARDDVKVSTGLAPDFGGAASDRYSIANFFGGEVRSSLGGVVVRAEDDLNFDTLQFSGREDVRLTAANFNERDQNQGFGGWILGYDSSVRSELGNISLTVPSNDPLDGIILYRTNLSAGSGSALGNISIEAGDGSAGDSYISITGGKQYVITVDKDDYFFQESSEDGGILAATGAVTMKAGADIQLDDVRVSGNMGITAASRSIGVVNSQAVDGGMNSSSGSIALDATERINVAGAVLSGATGMRLTAPSVNITGSPKVVASNGRVTVAASDQFMAFGAEGSAISGETGVEITAGRVVGFNSDGELDNEIPGIEATSIDSGAGMVSISAAGTLNINASLIAGKTGAELRGAEIILQNSDIDGETGPASLVATEALSVEGFNNHVRSDGDITLHGGSDLGTASAAIGSVAISGVTIQSTGGGIFGQSADDITVSASALKAQANVQLVADSAQDGYGLINIGNNSTIESQTGSVLLESKSASQITGGVIVDSSILLAMAGNITLQTAGAPINVTSSTLSAKMSGGTILIDTGTAVSSSVSLTNNTMSADIIRARSFRTDGGDALTINGGTYKAETLLKFYADGTSTLRFNGQVNLNTPDAHLAGHRVVVSEGGNVTGSDRVTVYANDHQYNVPGDPAIPGVGFIRANGSPDTKPTKLPHASRPQF